MEKEEKKEMVKGRSATKKKKKERKRGEHDWKGHKDGEKGEKKRWCMGALYLDWYTTICAIENKKVKNGSVLYLGWCTTICAINNKKVKRKWKSESRTLRISTSTK